MNRIAAALMLVALSCGCEPAPPVETSADSWEYVTGDPDAAKTPWTQQTYRLRVQGGYVYRERMRGGDGRPAVALAFVPDVAPERS